MISSEALIPLTGLSISLKVPMNVNANPSTFIEYLDLISSSNTMTFTKGEFYFSDDMWDFSSYITTNISPSKAKLNFSTSPPIFKKILKYYVISELYTNKRKIQTIHEYLKLLTHFMSFAEEQSYYDVEDLSIDLIQDYFDYYNSSASKRYVVLNAIKLFLVFYDYNYNKIITKSLINYVDSITKKRRSNNKTPDIPHEYFDNLIKSSIRIIDSSDPDDVPYKGVSAIVILLGQTGLRVGELLDLEEKSFKETIIFNNDKVMYLQYYTWKRERGNNKRTLVDTYLTELACKAISCLLELYKEKRGNLTHKYLFLYDNNFSNKPVSPCRFNKIVKHFYLYINKYMPTLNLARSKFPELSSTLLTSFKGPSEKYKEDYIIHPTAPQYRVHVSTELFNKGVPLDYIQKFYGHLSSYMQGYYVRPEKAYPQEDMKYSLEVLKQIVKGDIEPLGGKGGLQERINDFIRENKYSLSKDLDTICAKLMKIIPIRQKTGGVCIKSSMFRECEIDAPTNEFYCAYNVCPNIYHFYTMLPFTYKQAQDLERSIGINTKNGFKKQAQKEGNMLYIITSTRLTTEMQSMKKLISKNGVDYMLNQHPELLKFINDFDTIMEEIKQWTKR